MHEKENALVWSNIFNDMFQVPSRECTPAAILETMKSLTEMLTPKRKERKALTLDDITHHAKIRNVTCTESEVLDCLRTLYRQGEIRHKAIDGNHRFLIETL